MAANSPTDVEELIALAAQGEGSTIEFKRSTGELKEAMQTLCGFLNGSGGTVFFGVRSDGAVEGQEVGDETLRNIAQAADRFEPPVHVAIERFKIKPGREVIAVGVDGGLDAKPFTPPVAAQVTAFCRVPKSAKEIMAELRLKHWKTFQRNYLMPLLAAHVIERTIPDKPRSRLQKYRVTNTGTRALKV